MSAAPCSQEGRIYDFHSLRLGLFGDIRIAEALDARLGAFPRRDADVAATCDIRFEFRSDRPKTAPERSPGPEEARLIYQSEMGRVLYEASADRMFIESVWPIRVTCDPARGEAVFSVEGAIDEHLWALAHPLFTIPLIEMLKRANRYSVHAAGVALGERALVIAGSSGSGKSTLALALAREGFGFLGDDMLFLVHGSDGLRAQAFPESFDLTDGTVRLFPELADLLLVPKPHGAPKRQLRIDDRFGSPIAWQCRPTILIFPHVGRGTSLLEPISKDEALLEIVPNILLTEATSSQKHLDMLAELVASCPCYRLATGTDFRDLAHRLRDLLEAQP